MQAALDWQEDSPPLPAAPSAVCAPPRACAGQLPPSVEAALWRGTELGRQATCVIGSGWAELDRELPGGGWPCQSLTEILCPQPAQLEWRLLGGALRRVTASGGQVAVVGPPKLPHMPGLRHAGLHERQLIWIQAATPAERLWTTEQLIKSNGAGTVLAWLPQARPDQLRRLQVCAQACDGPVFLLRPDTAQFDASPAPLRVLATFAPDWELHVRLLKRRGALHDGTLVLPSVPGGLEAVLTPRLRKPSRLFAPAAVSPAAISPAAVPPARAVIPSREVAADVVGSPSSFPERPRRQATARSPH